LNRHIKVKEYLDIICSQIRYKKIHAEICEEIENHINDQIEAFKAQGDNDETATIKAIEQMGDPVVIGTELDRVHRPKPEWSIIVLTFLLLAAGNFLRFFTSPQESNGLELYYKQLIFTAIGFALMVLCYYVDFTLIGKYPKLIFLSLFIFTILIIVISNPVHGRFVYASYLLLLFPVAFAGIVYSMRNKGYWGIIFCGMCFGVSFIISLTVPSATSCILLALSCLLILTAAILKNWFAVKKFYALLLIYLPALTFLSILFSTKVYRKRLKIALFPSIDPTGAGYIENIIREILSGANFIGQGILPKSYNGISVSQLLPDINSDHLLTYTIHRFGWIAFIIITVLLSVLIIRSIILCFKQKSALAFLVSTAATTTIAMQSLFYIVANLGFQIFSPLSLPLISQSSSYLLINMCLIGILLSVFRTGYFIKDKNDNNRGSKKASANSFLRFEDGKLIIDFNIHNFTPQ